MCQYFVYVMFFLFLRSEGLEEGRLMYYICHSCSMSIVIHQEALAFAYTCYLLSVCSEMAKLLHHSRPDDLDRASGCFGTCTHVWESGY